MSDDTSNHYSNAFGTDYRTGRIEAVVEITGKIINYTSCTLCSFNNCSVGIITVRDLASGMDITSTASARIAAANRPGNDLLIFVIYIHPTIVQ
ncbi:MAG: hypothetical protein IKP95_00715 [Ruminococcus sp.]|nr:hypothetical protein [Ruminococcus sp.]